MLIIGHQPTTTEIVQVIISRMTCTRGVYMGNGLSSWLFGLSMDTILLYFLATTIPSTVFTAYMDDGVAGKAGLEWINEVGCA